MNKQEINPVIAIAAVVLLLGFLGGMFWYFTKPATALRAGIDYTPGVPPWQDPKYKGPKVSGPNIPAPKPGQSASTSGPVAR
jgi:hypothetical protein